MTLMARVSAERAAQSKAAATSSGVKPKRCVMRGMTSTFLLAIRLRQSGYCREGQGASGTDVAAEARRPGGRLGRKANNKAAWRAMRWQ